MCLLRGDRAATACVTDETGHARLAFALPELPVGNRGAAAPEDEPAGGGFAAAHWLGVIRCALVKSQHPPVRSARSYRTPPSALNDALIRDGAVVGDLSDVLMQQARSEIREGTYRVNGPSWNSQCVLSLVDPT